jgi:O-antigen ligase
MVLGLTLALFLVLMLELAAANQGEGLIDRTTEAVETFTFARGAGSFTGRLAVYEATLTGFVERPVFGWGTERDVEGLEYPAGSHSEYFAVLYRQGLFGLFAFIGLLWSAWRATRPPSGTVARQPAGAFLRYGRWFFVTALINSIMNDPAIDTTTYVLLWLLIALLIATAQLIRQRTDDAVRNN